MKKLYFCALILFSLLFTSCPKDLTVLGATIDGYTYTYDMADTLPIPGIPVRLIRSSAVFMQTVSDASAYYIFSPVPAGTYDVQATYKADINTNLSWGMFSGVQVTLNGSPDNFANYSYTGDITSGTDVVITRADLTVAIGESVSLDFEIQGY